MGLVGADRSAAWEAPVSEVNAAFHSMRQDIGTTSVPQPDRETAVGSLSR